MKIHADQKENHKKKVDKMKDDIARMNREIQKRRKENR